MKVILSHPTGNANVRAALDGFLEAEILYQFYTSVASFPGGGLDRIGNFSAFSEIGRRGFDSRLKSITTTFPWMEMGRLIASKFDVLKPATYRGGFFSIDNVYQSMDNHVAAKLQAVAKHGVSSVYAYEDAAANTFTKAKLLGIKCLYDLPIGYWRTARYMMEHEQERWPEWSATLTGLKDAQIKLEQKDEELRLADCIFVASTFTATTLNDYPATLAPVKVIPYGFPPVTAAKEYRQIGTGPLKLLFVGGLSQRKGIADLFDVVNKIGRHLELTIVGRKVGQDCKALDSQLIKHNWIPTLPHADVLKIMRQHDVLIFPSLFEGFGLVITEAMAQGTPVITTDRTAGPDIIENDRNGWVITAGSTDKLQEAIERLLYKPHKVAANGKEAIESARKRPWFVYSKELAEAIINRDEKKNAQVAT